MKFQLAALALASVLLTACASGPEKPPKCKGPYTAINAPEKYLSPADKERVP